MATPAAKGRMAALARNRVTEAGPALASLLGVEWPETLKSKDIDIQRIREQEALAEFLEAAIDKLGFLGNGEPVEGQEGSITMSALAFDIDAAYEAYDSDERVGGPDGYEAFVDAVTAMIEQATAATVADEAEGAGGEESTDDSSDDATSSDELVPSPDESGGAAADDETAPTGPPEEEPKASEPDTTATPAELKPVGKASTKAKAK